MATCVIKEFLLARNVVFQQVRFSRNRVNIQRPKPPHFEKERFLNLTKPYYATDGRALVDKCKVAEQRRIVEELTPLDLIYAAEIRQDFRESKLSAIFTRNPMNPEQHHMVKVMVFQANMKLVMRKRAIVEEALKGTEYVNLLPLFRSHNLMIFSPELKIMDLFQFGVKEPRISLIAGVIDNRILSVTELRTLSLLKDLQTAQAQLVQVVQLVPQSVHSSLERHQNMLLQHLNQRVLQLKESLSADPDLKREVNDTSID